MNWELVLDIAREYSALSLQARRVVTRQVVGGPPNELESHSERELEQAGDFWREMLSLVPQLKDPEQMAVGCRNSIYEIECELERRKTEEPD